MTMTHLSPEKMQIIIEAALMVAGQPLSITSLQQLFDESIRPSQSDVKALLSAIKLRFQDSGIELHEVASGYRLQAKAELSPWLSKLWEERAPRYSRAFLETLAIIAYKQPITRAEIEEIRGVTVSSHIVKTLLDREWIRVVGVKDVPGKPAILGTTKNFLDHFNLKSLTDLPSLAEFKNFEAQEAQLQVQLAMENSQLGVVDSEAIPSERDAITQDEAIEIVEVIAIDETDEIIEITDEAIDADDSNIISFHEKMQDRQEEEIINDDDDGKKKDELATG